VTDTMTPKQLDAMFDMVDNAELARQERNLHEERRRAYIVDYLLAAEEADKAPKGTARGRALRDTRRALAAFLANNGEYPSIEAAADAVDARTVRSMPQPGTDYSKVVPF